MDVCGTSLDALRPLYDSHSGLLYQHLCVSGLPPISSPHPLLEQGVVVIQMTFLGGATLPFPRGG